MTKRPAMAGGPAPAWARWNLLAAAMQIAVVGTLLGGCTQSLPERATSEETPEAESEVAETAATTTPAADEPLPWPPANGEIPMPQEAAAAGKMFEWHGDGRRVTRIVIDTDTQQARFFDDGDLIGWSTVATGVSSHRTPTGEFSVLEKVANKRSNLYGRIYDGEGKLVKRNAKAGRDAVPSGGRFVGARMPHFMRMTFDGVGMHAGPIPRPGSPASHGCIRMPVRVADALFDHVELGARVTVIGSQGPSYGNYAARVQQRQGEARARQAAVQARRDGDPIDVLDAEIAALRGEDFPPAATDGAGREAGEAAAESRATESRATESQATESRAIESRSSEDDAGAAQGRGGGANAKAGARSGGGQDDDAATSRGGADPSPAAGEGSGRGSTGEESVPADARDTDRA